MTTIYMAPRHSHAVTRLVWDATKLVVYITDFIARIREALCDCVMMKNCSLLNMFTCNFCYINLFLDTPLVHNVKVPKLKILSDFYTLHCQAVIPLMLSRTPKC